MARITSIENPRLRRLAQSSQSFPITPREMIFLEINRKTKKLCASLRKRGFGSSPTVANRYPHLSCRPHDDGGPQKRLPRRTHTQTRPWLAQRNVGERGPSGGRLRGRRDHHKSHALRHECKDNKPNQRMQL